MFGWTIVKKEHELLMKPKCWICGKKFYVRVRLKDRKITTKCYHSYIHKRWFLKWYYPIENLRDFMPLPWYKKLITKESVSFDKKVNFIWRILGCCRLTRQITYHIWKIIWGRATLQYWECFSCSNRKDD